MTKPMESRRQVAVQRELPEESAQLDVSIQLYALHELLRRRLIVAEDFRCQDSQTKGQVKRLLISAAANPRR